LLFLGHFCNYFENNIAYFSKGVWSAVSSPSGVRGTATEAIAFLGFTEPQILQKRLKYYLVDQFVVNFLIAILSN